MPDMFWRKSEKYTLHYDFWGFLSAYARHSSDIISAVWPAAGLILLPFT